MSVLVLDSSIAFDLERGGLIEVCFKLDHAYVTPDLLYLKELHDGCGPYLRGLGMQVIELTANEVSNAQALAAQNKRVSTPDCWAAVAAKREHHKLLTGDAHLRALANGQGIPCSGLLWLLNVVEQAKLVTPDVLIEGLSRTCRHARCRLPKAEVKALLDRWEKQRFELQGKPV